MSPTCSIGTLPDHWAPSTGLSSTEIRQESFERDWALLDQLEQREHNRDRKERAMFSDGWGDTDRTFYLALNDPSKHDDVSSKIMGKGENDFEVIE